MRVSFRGLISSRLHFYIFTALALTAGTYLSLSGKSLHGLTTILWLFIIFPIFGYSLSSFVLKKRNNIAETIVYSAGLLIVFLMSLGLALNTIGLLTHTATLVPKFIVSAFDVLFFCTLMLASMRNPGLFSFVRKPKLTKQNLITYLPVIFPALSIIGAIQLNNGGSGFFAVMSLCVLGVYQLLFFSSKIKRTELSYVINIFCVSLALIWSFSMRSNHIIGFDINQEFEVFSSVVKNGLWHPHLFNSTYNACLSITVLPAIVKSFLQLSSEYVFKFAMQFILCLIPIIVFVIANKLLKSQKKAFLASLFFVVQNQFIVEFPALIRQQTALLFFGLLLMVASSDNLNKGSKKLLFLLFGAGLIVSHYTTAYVCIAFLLILVLFKPIAERMLSFTKNKNKASISWEFPPILILVLLLLVFFWYGQTLESTGSVIKNIEKSVTNFNSLFTADSRSSFVTNNLNLAAPTYNNEVLNQLAKTRSIQDSFPSSIYSASKPILTSPKSPTLDSPSRRYTYDFFYKAVPLIIKIVAVIGSLVILFETLMGRRGIEEGLFVISGGIIFLALILLPFISQDYNLERLYQQLLIALSATIVLGFKFITNKLPKLTFKIALVSILIYLASTSGLASQLMLGSSDVNIANDGDNYDKFYVKNGELDSLSWLNGNYNNISGINVDDYATLRFRAFTKLPSNKFIIGMLPSEVSKNGYLYATSSNLDKNVVFDRYKNRVITYSFPSNLVSQYKNTVYVNEDSRVYK